jgi:hypothetical protein
MISTGTLMVGKALLTATVLSGFGVFQLVALKRMKRRDEEAKRAEAREDEAAEPLTSNSERTDSQRR